MRLPQLIVYESDGRFAHLFRTFAEQQRWEEKAKDRAWSLHEVRDPEQCRTLLRRGGPAVVVVQLSRNPESELALVAHVTRCCTEAAAVVVTSAEHKELTGLAWDLGAHFVFLPTQPRALLLDIVCGWLGVTPKPVTEEPRKA